MQRHEAARAIVEALAAKGEYLFQEPAVDHNRLARLLTVDDAVWLRKPLEGPEAAGRANALLLLGHLRIPYALDQAIAVALDRTSELELRRSAFAVVKLAGSPELIPTLLGAYDPDDPLATLCLDSACTLVTPDTLAQVLPLIETTTNPIDASLHIGGIRTREMLVAVLDYLLAHPDAACNSQIAAYIQPAWKVLEKCVDPEILAKIGRLFANCERRGNWDQQLKVRSDLLKSLSGRDPSGIVSRTALEVILRDNLTFHFCAFTIARLCTAETARWLLEQDPPAQLVIHLASCANEAVREILRPATGGLVDQQDEAGRQFQRQEAGRGAREQASLEARFRTEKDIGPVLGAFAALTPSQWPTISTDRTAWLAAAVCQKLAEVDCLHSVEWINESQRRCPPILPLLADLAGHYGLPLENDTLLIHALLALHPSSLHEYHRRRPLSSRALAEFEREFSASMRESWRGK